jgi:hypothetical protein
MAAGWLGGAVAESFTEGYQFSITDSLQPFGLIQWCLLELQAWHYAQCRVNSYYTNVLNPGSLGLLNPADLV